jgi:hypothetical protein
MSTTVTGPVPKTAGHRQVMAAADPALSDP